MMKASIPKLPSGDVLVYKYGCRLDPDCVPIVNEQITLARRLYNDLVAEIQKAVNERSAHEFELAGTPAKVIQEKIEALTADFTAAKAANDESGMKAAATARRALWADLAQALKAVRNEHKQDLRSHLARIGKNSECSTYKIRSHYVTTEGLGWATANRVLDAALQAFQSTIKRGQAPRFAIGSLITRDTLSLQFTTAGGVDATKLLDGAHNELTLTLPQQGCGRRSYGAFKMRMGSAKSDQWATGTWQAHRPIPPGAHVAGASLVRERVGNKFSWNIQLLLKLPAPMTAPVPEQREPIAVIHMGWSSDPSGRRIAAVASAADPGLATIIQLPAEIEARLQRSSDIQSTRDASRDEIVQAIKLIPVEVTKGWPEVLQEEWNKIKRLPHQHVASSRLHRLWWLLHKADLITADLQAFSRWRAADRIDHQSSVGLARSARGMRKNFYRNLALRQCQQYGAIILDQPDLKEAAQKIDENTGERNELGRLARSGRVVAALYEYSSALAWAAARCGTTLIEVGGETASTCSICGSTGLVTVEGTHHQQQQCPSCSALLDRKSNAAASTYQLMRSSVDTQVAEAKQTQAASKQADQEKLRLRLAKVQEARRKRSESNAEPDANANPE